MDAPRVVLGGEDEGQRQSTEVVRDALVGLARGHDEQPGVVVGAVPVIDPRLGVPRVLEEPVVVAHARQMLEAIIPGAAHTRLRTWRAITGVMALIFAGMVYYASRMVFGAAPAGMTVREVDAWSTAALFLPLAIIVVFGVYLPAAFSEALHKIVVVVQGGY